MDTHYLGGPRYWGRWEIADIGILVAFRRGGIGGKPTLDTIRHLFGDRVADIVLECSDSDATDPAQKLPSAERKRTYLQHLPNISNEALLVALADKVHNARSVLADYQQIGDAVWNRFNVGKEEQLRYYSRLLEIFRERSAPARLTDEFGRVVGELTKAAGYVAL